MTLLDTAQHQAFLNWFIHTFQALPDQHYTYAPTGIRFGIYSSRADGVQLSYRVRDSDYWTPATDFIHAKINNDLPDHLPARMELWELFYREIAHRSGFSGCFRHLTLFTAMMAYQHPVSAP